MSLKISELKELLELISERDITEFELEEDGVKLVVRKNATMAMVQPPQAFAPYGAGYGAPMYPPMPPVYPQAAPRQAHLAPASSGCFSPSGRDR